MNRRRALVFAGMLAAPLLAVGAACTFPDVNFDTKGDSSLQGGPDSSDSSTSNTGDGPTSIVPDNDSDVPTVLADGATTGDVIEIGDAATVDAAGCDARCDCDNDGYLRTDCTGITAFDDPDSGKAGGGDCIDTDPNVHPNINTYVKSVPTPPNVGDWNCDKTVERSVKPAKNCTGSNTSAIPCSGIPGETTQSTCGALTDYYTCQGTGFLTCGFVLFDQRIQNCK